MPSCQGYRPGPCDIPPQRYCVFETGKHRSNSDDITGAQIPIKTRIVQREILDSAKRLMISLFNSLYRGLIVIRKRSEAAGQFYRVRQGGLCLLVRR